MKSFRFAFPLACATALIAVGCGGNGFIDSNRDNGLAGTWVLSTIAVDGAAAVTCPGTAAASDVNIGCSAIKNTFTEDGHYSTASADGSLTQSGTFTYDRVILTTIVGNEDVHAPATVASDHNTYTMTMHQFGHSVVFAFTKVP
jgi:hypothetical protein